MEEKQVLIEKPKPWLIDMDKKRRELPGAAAESEHWKKRSIYKIPASVTAVNKRAYNPQIVSIGPYHHGMEHLKAMEEHKCRALLHFLKRSNISLEILVEALVPEVQVLKDAYDQLDPKWNEDDDKFLEVMITDGCFILEILRTTNEELQQSGGADQSSNDQDYATNDPIFSHHGKLYIVPYLKRDMLMLENQIPILVLLKLICIQNNTSHMKREELTKLILEFFPTVSDENLNQFNECLHILCVYRKSMLLKGPPARRTKDGKRGNRNPDGEEIIRSATELNEAGIKIKPSKNKSLKDISFQKGILRGTLSLPVIEVDDSLESLYLNLIAFERFHAGAGNEVTSYIFFMDNIIDNESDVILLHQCKIIQKNGLGSDKAVAKLFNTLSKDITLDPGSSLNVVRRDVSNYCQKPWHRWRAGLWHTYFTNPWAFISFIAAIFLFALTILQSVYGVLSYIKQSTPGGG